MLALLLSCALVGAIRLGAGHPRPFPHPVVWVDPAGSDTLGDGSAANPFRTLQRAHDAVDVGGTIRARAGAYPGALAIGKRVRIEREGQGSVVVGPPPTGTATVSVAASDVSLVDLDFAAGAARALELTAGDRLRVERCSFAGGGIRIAAPSSAGHLLEACSFVGVRATPAATAVAIEHASGVVCRGGNFRECDVGVRLSDCPGARVEECTFVDLFQAALVATGSPDLVVERCRCTRCGWFPRPAEHADPTEQLGTISLVNGSARARVGATVVEDCGGYTGKNTFRAGAVTAFDGLFALAVLDSEDVLVQDCALHRNRFGGVWVGGASTGLTVARCNLVANGGDNDPGKDVAIYSDGLAVSAPDCFFGVPGGPTFDGDGPGNGVLGGSVAATPFAARPFETPAHGVVAHASVPAPAGTVCLAADDLTGDGWIDLIAAGDLAGALDVHRNGPGGFEARETIVLPGSAPVALATGAFDAQAPRDVAVLDAAGARVVVLAGDGTGHLQPAGSVAVGRQPRRMLAANLDGRTGTDLVIACQGDAFGAGAVLVLRNDGTAQFTVTSLAGAVAPCAVAALDLDGDGDLDLAAFDLDPAGPGLLLWANDGSGAFGGVRRVPVDQHPVVDASLAVLDQDGGAPDLAVASFQLLPLPGVGRVRLFRGDGSGGLLAPVDLCSRAGPVELVAGALADTERPSLLAVDRAARTVLALGPLAADTAASHGYAQTFAALPVHAVIAPLTNRSAADVAVAEAAAGSIVVQRARRVARVEAYGTGCAGGAGVPRARWTSLPEIGSATFALGFEGAVPSAPAALALGITPLDLTLPGGCKLLVDLLVTVGGGSDAAGAGATPLAVPALPELLGAALFGQYFVVDPAGGLFGTLAATDGVRVVVGG